jgi:Proteasome assembly chaperone 3
VQAAKSKATSFLPHILYKYPFNVGGLFTGGFICVVPYRKKSPINQLSEGNMPTTAATVGKASAFNQQPIITVALPDSIPKLLTRSFLVLSVPTHAFVQLFSDRIVFGVSQLDCKIGNWLLCEAVTNEINIRQTEYHLSTLLGNREDSILGLYARTLHERLRQLQQQGTNQTPGVVLLGISLDKEQGSDPQMFRLLVDLLVDMYVDAIKERPDE